MLVLIEIPLALYNNNVRKDVITRENIELFLYENNKGFSQNEIRLDKNLLLFVRQGNKNLALCGDTMNLNNNYGALIAKDTYLMSEICNEQTGIFSSIMLMVDDYTLLKLWNEVISISPKVLSIEPTDKKSNWRYFKQTPYIKSSLNTLELYTKNNESIPYSLLETKLRELLIYLSKTPCAHHINILIKQINNNNKSVKLKGFMEENYTQNWSINQFARNYGFSLSTFKRIFKDSFGVTPKSWVNERRLEQATSELAIRKVPLIRLALELGYSDSSQFSRAFRKKYNCPPSVYTRQKLSKI